MLVGCSNHWVIGTPDEPDYLIEFLFTQGVLLPVQAQQRDFHSMWYLKNGMALRAWMNENHIVESTVTVEHFAWIRTQSKYGMAVTKGKHRFLSFAEVKPCWTGLITGWVTIWIIPCAVLLGKSGWYNGHQSRLPPLLQNVVCGLTFTRSQPDFEGFLWALLSPQSRLPFSCLSMGIWFPPTTVQLTIFKSPS